MLKEEISIRVDVDPESNLELQKWAKEEGRSKRRHLSILAKKLMRIRREKPDALKALAL